MLPAWTTAIPDGWQVVPLRAVADYEVSNVDKKVADGELPVRLCNYVDVYNNEFITLELEFMEATASENEIAKFRLQQDDVIITKDSESWDDIGVPALVRGTADDLVCGYHLAQIRPRQARIDGGFLLRCLQAKPIRLHLELSANGVTRFGLPKGEIGGTPLPLPPLSAQRAIADYLDAETARLDELIAAKENLLGILAEKRKALVTQAVTRGLDPDVPMRDSGIPWLGEIPAHWGETRLRFLVDTIEQGWSPQAQSRQPEDDEWGVLKLSAVSRGEFDPSAAKAMLPESEPRTEYEIQPGDFLITRSNTPSRVGDVCYVKHTPAKLMLCDLIYRLALRRNLVDGRYLAYFLGLPLGRTQIESDARGTSGSMVKIAQEHIKNWWIPTPPPKEQKAIAQYLERELKTIGRVEEANLATVQLLRERREAVIAAAVTGKLELGAP